MTGFRCTTSGFRFSATVSRGGTSICAGDYRVIYSFKEVFRSLDPIHSEISALWRVEVKRDAFSLAFVPSPRGGSELCSRNDAVPLRSGDFQGRFGVAVAPYDANAHRTSTRTTRVFTPMRSLPALSHRYLLLSYNSTCHQKMPPATGRF